MNNSSIHFLFIAFGLPNSLFWQRGREQICLLISLKSSSFSKKSSSVEDEMSQNVSSNSLIFLVIGLWIASTKINKDLYYIWLIRAIHNNLLLTWHTCWQSWIVAGKFFVGRPRSKSHNTIIPFSYPIRIRLWSIGESSRLTIFPGCAFNDGWILRENMVKST